MHAAQKDTLAGQVALVTGAGSGIGKATANALAAAGAHVIALGHEQSAVAATAEEISRAGGKSFAIVADVSNGAQMKAAVSQVRDHAGRLDIVVANAGINGLWAPVEEISEAEWDRTFDVNLKGTFLTIKYTVPLLKVRGGTIVVVSSVNGTRMFSNAGASAYATSKAGQAGLAKMMALELASAGIRVNVVCPGSTRTRIGESTTRRNLESVRPAIVLPNGPIPLTGGHLASPDQIADLIWFLASPLSSHITGAEVFIDGGESLLRG